MSLQRWVFLFSLFETEASEHMGASFHLMCGYRVPNCGDGAVDLSGDYGGRLQAEYFAEIFSIFSPFVRGQFCNSPLCLAVEYTQSALRLGVDIYEPQKLHICL